MNYETMRWQSLCLAFLNPDIPFPTKVEMLKEMKSLVAFVE